MLAVLTPFATLLIINCGGGGDVDIQRVLQPGLAI